MAERGRFLAALAAAGVSLILLDRVIPRAGTLIAAGIAFWWMMTSGGAEWIIDQTNKLVRGVGRE